MAGWTIHRLRSADDRSGFSSGHPDLDRFFVRYAGQNQFRHHIGTTYIAVEGDRILGFVTISASSIEVRQLPAGSRRKLPRYPIPVLRLARLAVDQRARGQGIGLALLRAVLTLARQMSNDVGCVGVVVDAKPGALDFYIQFGFEEIEVTVGRLGDRPEPVPLFLEIGAIPEGE